MSEAEKHSKNFEKYKKHYEDGFWTAEMVRRVTAVGKLTAKEFEEITGEPYEGE